MSRNARPTIGQAVRALDAELGLGARRHPDGDVLADYAEDNLSSVARDLVAVHLSGCRDCASLVADRHLLSHQAPAPDLSPLSIEAAWKDLQARRAATPDRLASAPEPRAPTPEPLAPAPALRAPTPEPVARSRQWGAAFQLAATVVLVAGWAILGFRLNDAREAYRGVVQPKFGVVIAEPNLAGANRGTEQERTVLTFDREMDRAVLVLTPTETVRPGSAFVGRIRRDDGTVAFGDVASRATSFGTFTLELLRDSLPAGSYRVEIEVTEGPMKAVERFPISIVHAGD